MSTSINATTTYTCQDCGAISLLKDALITTGSGRHVCKECITNNYVICDDCEEYFPKYVCTNREDTGACLCQACLRSYTKCDECGKYYYTDELLTTQAGDLVCESCAADRYDECDQCGKLTYYEDLTETYDGAQVCPDCIGENYTSCDICEAYFPSDDCYFTQVDGRVVCQHCLERHYERCHDCGEYCTTDDIQETQDGYWVCPTCANASYANCEDCGDLCHLDNIVGIHNGDLVCERCIDDHYARCEGCDELFHEDSLDSEGYCEGCAEDNIYKVHNYAYKPTPFFHTGEKETTQSKLYIGVELELSHDSCSEKHANINKCFEILNYNTCSEGNIYLKEDASLTKGFEIVSHPRTLASWYEYSKYIRRYFEIAQIYTKGDRDGLHVHISRKGMTTEHQIRLGAFVAQCQDEITTIARRTSEQWAAYHKKPKTGHDVKQTVSTENRYVALNWRNRSTVEFRVFRSTLNIIEFMAAIEFCHAAYRFTKIGIGIMQIVKENPWQAFLSFLHTYKDKYHNLISFLETKYQEQEDTYKSYLDALTPHKKVNKGKK